MSLNLENLKKLIEVISENKVEFEKGSTEEGSFKNLQALIKKLTAAEFNKLQQSQNYENALVNDFHTLINYCNNNNISYE